MEQHALVKGHYFGVAMLLPEGNAAFKAAFVGWDLMAPGEAAVPKPKRRKMVHGTGEER
jgi:hypothetical protein